ncbi:MAG: adenylate/guanylate cyclase domain-containing protein [Leptospiraceae bacterium]|nr:adenylate/guanylate cyclase domain-containing protein [Leptospiraceae bacterium]
MSGKKTSLTALNLVILGIGGLSLISILITPLLAQESFYYYYLLLSTIFLLVIAYPFYKTLEKTNLDKQLVGGLWIALLISLIAYTAPNILTILNNAEESSISWRFRMLKGKTGKSSAAQGKTGYVEKFNPPENARQDIKIIGIKTETFEKLQGNWPIQWEEYAKIIKSFKKTNNIMFFDIFFLDYKKGQMEEMVKALSGSNNIIVDYPIETDAAARNSIVNLKERNEILRKYKLVNVQDPDNKGLVWLEMTNPPIEPIAELVAGIGFANIKKEDNATNRRMPLLAKLIDHGPNGETEFFPSIDLIAVCAYYGIDVVKDTEIVMGKYVKLKNIPKKTVRDRKGEHDVMMFPNEEREIVIPIDEYGQMEINFVGPLFSFKDEEFHEVANDWDENTAAQFENNIFLIAMYYATGAGAPKDTHISPYGEMSGIEHHAQAINTILNQDFLKNSSPAQNLFLILLFGLSIGFFQPKLKTLTSFGLFLLVLALYLTISLVAFIKLNLLIQLPTPLIGFSLTFVSIIGFKILTEEENVKYIRNTFSKFVSKDVVDELLKNPEMISLGGAKKEITVFFSDVRGFTTMSEALTPEELVKLLNEYLTEMTETIIEFKGTIDKYMGDAIMAFWGAPIELEDHPYYACVVSIVQLEQLKRLQASWKERNLPSIDIGIGLNTGPAVVGNMGSSHRMDYTCMGDTVNLGSRLEGSNKMYATRIIMSEYTYERVKERVYARELDLVKVKGKTHPVRIYELIGLINDADVEKMKRPIQKTS